MKQQTLIIGCFAMLVIFGACTQERPASVDVAADEAAKNALEAERAEEELAKLAELQRQSEGRPAKGSRKPASVTQAAKKAAKNETGALKALNDHAGKLGSVYVLQVGSFRVKENAVNLESKLKSSGFPVRMKEVVHAKSGQLYVVQFEPTPNKAEADEWRSQVKEKVALDAQVLARPE